MGASPIRSYCFQSDLESLVHNSDLLFLLDTGYELLRVCADVDFLSGADYLIEQGALNGAANAGLAERLHRQIPSLDVERALAFFRLDESTDNDCPLAHCRSTAMIDLLLLSGLSFNPASCIACHGSERSSLTTIYHRLCRLEAGGSQLQRVAMHAWTHGAGFQLDENKRHPIEDAVVYGQAALLEFFHTHLDEMETEIPALSRFGSHGGTLLHEAVGVKAAVNRRDTAVCIRYLLTQGVDPEALDWHGHTALYYARERNLTRAVAVLQPMCRARGKEVVVEIPPWSPTWSLDSSPEL